jgi:hypothetical protein
MTTTYAVTTTDDMTTTDAMTTTDDMTTLVSNSTNNTGSSQGNYEYRSIVRIHLIKICSYSILVVEIIDFGFRR